MRLRVKNIIFLALLVISSGCVSRTQMQANQLKNIKQHYAGSSDAVWECFFDTKKYFDLFETGELPVSALADMRSCILSKLQDNRLKEITEYLSKL